MAIEIRFREVHFGFRHRGDKRFSIVANAHVAFGKGKGKDDEFYAFGEDLESTTRATLDEYRRNPDLYQRALTEIADKFAKLVAEDYGLPEE